MCWETRAGLRKFRSFSCLVQIDLVINNGVSFVWFTSSGVDFLLRFVTFDLIHFDHLGLEELLSKHRSIGRY